MPMPAKLPARKRGRPVVAWLTEADYLDLKRTAMETDRTISTILREALRDVKAINRA